VKTLTITLALLLTGSLALPVLAGVQAFAVVLLLANHFGMMGE